MFGDMGNLMKQAQQMQGKIICMKNVHCSLLKENLCALIGNKKRTDEGISFRLPKGLR